MLGPSRFASEPRRRAAIALMMCTLLAAATAAAAQIASASHRRHNPDLAAEEFDNFRFTRPAEWDASAAPAHSPDTRIYQEPGRSGRRLTVARIAAKAVTPPDTVLGPAAQLVGSVGAIRATSAQRIRRGHVLVTVLGLRSRDAEGRGVYHRLALATVDGRRYLMVNLSGPGVLAAQTDAIMGRIIASIDDTRYVLADQPLVVGGVAAPDIDSLLALRWTGDEDGRILFVPRTGDRFAVLQALPLDVSVPFDLHNARIAGAGEELVGVPIEMGEALHPDRQRSAADRLLAAMTWRYWRATGVTPPPGAGRMYPTDAGVIVELVLNAARRTTTFRALFGAVVDERSGVLVEVVAEHAAADAARKAAALLARGLRAASP